MSDSAQHAPALMERMSNASSNAEFSTAETHFLTPSGTTKRS